uniref:Uncharacterized protein n=1 Tax=Anopheles darlingi TaxID=43151 RepID=A0A2M4DQ02_ANODA
MTTLGQTRYVVAVVLLCVGNLLSSFDYHVFFMFFCVYPMIPRVSSFLYCLFHVLFRIRFVCDYVRSI